MNSRERLLKAFNHEEPDKVPLDLGGHISGIHIKAYKKLLEYLNIEEKSMILLNSWQFHAMTY